MPTPDSKHWWSADFHLACRHVYAQLHFKLLLTKAVLVVNGHMEHATATTETQHLHKLFSQESLILEGCPVAVVAYCLLCSWVAA
jgi:hypothetical protein